MTLLPDEITERQFAVSYGRGYDRREVDEFLSQIAQDYGSAIERIARSEGPSEWSAIEGVGEQVKSVLRAAKSSAEEIIAEARRQATSLSESAAARAQEIREAADLEVQKAKEEAFRRAQEAVDEADRSALQLRRETERSCNKLLETAEQRHRELIAFEQELQQRVAQAHELIESLRTALLPAGDDASKQESGRPQARGAKAPKNAQEAKRRRQASSVPAGEPALSVVAAPNSEAGEQTKSEK